MIIGNGLIAKSFINEFHDDLVLFASGVSNSLENDFTQFEREKNLLLKSIDAYKGKIFVYFSTCSIYDPSKQDSDYVSHKLAMERNVANLCDKYLIFRVSNVVGKGGNPNLLMNYLYSSLLNGNEISVYSHAERNLIDIEDVVKIVMFFCRNYQINKIINVAYLTNFSSLQIIECFEDVFSKKFIKRFKDTGESYKIDISDIGFAFDNSISPNKYLRNIIKKYYLID